jgi:hypothetical protein
VNGDSAIQREDDLVFLPEGLNPTPLDRVTGATILLRTFLAGHASPPPNHGPNPEQVQPEHVPE